MSFLLNDLEGIGFVVRMTAVSVMGKSGYKHILLSSGRGPRPHLNLPVFFFHLIIAKYEECVYDQNEVDSR